MKLSIVSGTYNRKKHLIRMVNSVRRQLPMLFEYEFVIVDGGSTDNTIDWCKNQSDIVLIEQGELTGAIHAFTAGAKQARGEYVVMANDDVEFLDYSILRALSYLEDTPTCGAVAFADNRHNEGYAVQYHVARKENGRPTRSIYAQVGMFPRWLGDVAGWWGGDDPHMSQARTYGADNYLSARIWECGYTIDAVSGVRCHDHVLSDPLRTKNQSGAGQDAEIYHTRFPGGPQFRATPIEEPERPAPLRIMYLPIIHHESQKTQKRSLFDALNLAGDTYQWTTDITHTEFVQRARALQPHVVFTQFHRVEDIGIRSIQQLRADVPGVVCINWNGDYWPEVYLDDRVVSLMKTYDVALVCNAAILPEYADRDITAAYFAQTTEHPAEYDGDVPAYDVLFCGNNYEVNKVAKRAQLVKTLKALKGVKVGIYGFGYGRGVADGETNYDFAKTQAMMQKATIVIGDMQFPDSVGYTSNRLYEALYCGAFFLTNEIVESKTWTGLVPGKHYATWTDYDDLSNQIKRYLKDEKAREKIRKAGYRYARRWHTYKARVKELFTKILPRVANE